MSTIAIILAGGTGTRLLSNEPKQFLKIGGKTLLEICLQRFQDHEGIGGIVLVCPKEHLSRAEKIAAIFSKVTKVLAGGATRQESSLIGVGAVPRETENVLVHDAARALVAPGVIDRVLAALAVNAAVMPVLPAGDTMVRVDDESRVMAVLDRGKLKRVQTPQGFRLELIRLAHELARAEGVTDAGDDCSLVLRGRLAPVVAVAGDVNNIKITYPEDLAIAEAILNLKLV
jgi:2-C-methyl-D-erythritol 4-phosphate cytidylyltransferase